MRSSQNSLLCLEERTSYPFSQFLLEVHIEPVIKTAKAGVPQRLRPSFIVYNFCNKRFGTPILRVPGAPTLMPRPLRAHTLP